MIRTAARKLRYGYAADSETFVRFLRANGMTIGEGCVFFDPPSNVIDVSNPELIEMGSNVRITHGVIILSHDYSWSVLVGTVGEILGGCLLLR